MKMEKILPCGCHKVTSDGRLFSCLQQFSKPGHQGIITQKSDVWREIEGTVRSSGYVQVLIHRRSVRMNRLIAINFIPNPLAYPEAQHIDGDRKNNKASNLKWGNQKHNADDRDGHGHTMRGERYPLAKLNDVAVREIRALRASSNLSLNQIADKYSVSKKLILLVVQNRIWRHVK